MKTKTFLITGTLIATGLFNGCQKEPSACFTMSKSSAVVGEEITFTNCTLEGVNYEWNFGDNTTSNEESPKHAYSSTGTYTITLKSTSKKDKKTDFITETVTINCPDGYEGSDCSTEESAKFLGTWNVDDACSGSGYNAYTSTISKSGINSINISNFWGVFLNPVTANVDGIHLIIPLQEPDLDGYWVKGSGTIINNELIIDYSVDDSNTSDNCTGTWLK